MLLDKIQKLVNEGVVALGQRIPIPPIVGDTIARRRRRLSELETVNQSSLQHHTGWAEAYGLSKNVGVIDSLTYEGAQSGLWDMEDVFTLPAPMTPVSPDILEHFEVDGFDGSEVYLA
jgi:hypothetical protein